MSNQATMRVVGYTVCWESSDPMGSGSTEYGVVYPKTEDEAFSIIKESGRDTLKRTVKVMDRDRSGKFLVQRYDFDRKEWEK